MGHPLPTPPALLLITNQTLNPDKKKKKKNANLLLPTAATLLLFLLFLSPLAASGSSFVVDHDGKPLEVGTPYYVLTSFWGAAGAEGLTMANKPGQNRCPKFLGQLWGDLNRGWPVIFFPSDEKQTQVHVSSDVNILLLRPSFCRKGVWQVTADAASGNTYVSTGGPFRDHDAVDTWFKIEKVGNEDINAYNIVYCPTSGDIMCGVIDSVEPEPMFGLSWLGLDTTNNPSTKSIFVFEKA